jgi:hypothetical protein
VPELRAAGADAEDGRGWNWSRAWLPGGGGDGGAARR